MRLLTVLAVAAVAAGMYHYRKQRRPQRAEPEARLSDDLLAERVRSGIAGAASSPIEVRVANGVVTLRGTVRRAERDLALAAALAVPGVDQVANQLEIEDQEAPGMERGPIRAGMTRQELT